MGEESGWVDVQRTDVTVVVPVQTSDAEVPSTVSSQ